MSKFFREAIVPRMQLLLLTTFTFVDGRKISVERKNGEIKAENWGRDTKGRRCVVKEQYDPETKVTVGRAILTGSVRNPTVRVNPGEKDSVTIRESRTHSESGTLEVIGE